MANPREGCLPPTLVAVDHALIVKLRPEARACFAQAEIDGVRWDSRGVLDRRFYWH